jgi:aminocarboxymuconate-semialdehyde decarboxylase
VKLDIFNHIFPKPFYDRMLEVAPNGKDMHRRVREIPCIVDLDERFRVMDRFGEDYAQVICLPSPPIEVFGPPPLSTELARLANDGMAELVRRHPRRFPAFVASLPMNDPPACCGGRRAVRPGAGAVFTNVSGPSPRRDAAVRPDGAARPADWLHPARGAIFHIRARTRAT